MRMSPTQRSKAKLKADGWPLIEVVEHWNPFARCRQDLFGFIDILAVRDNEILAVQTTTGPNATARVSKILHNPAKDVWLASRSRRLEVHAWRKAGARGKRKVWECREIEVFSLKYYEPSQTLERERLSLSQQPAKGVEG